MAIAMTASQWAGSGLTAVRHSERSDMTLYRGRGVPLGAST
jgi:hypothetical protein